MNKVSYFKPFLTFEEQVQLLESRGLIVGSDENRKFLIAFLKNLNFYRFDAYCLRYYDTNSKKHKFIDGTSFMEIQEDYYADKRIRLETFDMIQDFEISLRSQFVDVLGTRYGIYPYSLECYHANEEEWQKLYRKHFLSALKKSNEIYIKTFTESYSNELPPIWMMIELLSLGELSQIYRRYLRNKDKIAIAKYYSVQSIVFESWLHCLTLLRNRCAHHAKLIDTNNPIRIAFPRRAKIEKYNHLMKKVDSNSFCGFILILCYLSEAMGRKGLAAKYILKIENIMDVHGIENGQLGLPEGLTITDITKELGFDSFVLNEL